MANLTEESKNNLYVLIDDPPRVETINIILDAGKNSNIETKIMPVWLSAEAVELIKEAEALAVNQYAKKKDKPDQLKMYNKHSQLVNELMEARNHLNP